MAKLILDLSLCKIAEEHQKAEQKILDRITAEKEYKEAFERYKTNVERLDTLEDGELIEFLSSENGKELDKSRTEAVDSAIRYLRTMRKGS